MAFDVNRIDWTNGWTWCRWSRRCFELIAVFGGQRRQWKLWIWWAFRVAARAIAIAAYIYLLWTVVITIAYQFVLWVCAPIQFELVVAENVHRFAAKRQIDAHVNAAEAVCSIVAAVMTRTNHTLGHGATIASARRCFHHVVGTTQLRQPDVVGCVLVAFCSAATIAFRI